MLGQEALAHYQNKIVVGLGRCGDADTTKRLTQELFELSSGERANFITTHWHPKILEKIFPLLLQLEVTEREYRRLYVLEQLKE